MSRLSNRPAAAFCPCPRLGGALLRPEVCSYFAMAETPPSLPRPAAMRHAAFGPPRPPACPRAPRPCLPAVAGIIDGMVHQVNKIAKKVELGKQG